MPDKRSYTHKFYWVVVVAFYSVGKNEIRNLLEKEAQIKSELRLLNKQSSSGVYSFKAIMLSNEMTKIQNKLRVLSFGNPTNGNDIA